MTKPIDEAVEAAYAAAVEAAYADPSDDWASAARDVLAWVTGNGDRPDIEGDPHD